MTNRIFCGIITKGDGSARLTPSDTLILTLDCGKYRINDMDPGDIDGIPRILDMGLVQRDTRGDGACGCVRGRDKRPPAVLEVLQEKFNLRAAVTPEDDIKMILG